MGPSMLAAQRQEALIKNMETTLPANLFQAMMHFFNQHPAHPLNQTNTNNNWRNNNPNNNNNNYYPPNNNYYPPNNSGNNSTHYSNSYHHDHPPSPVPSTAPYSPHHQANPPRSYAPNSPYHLPSPHHYHPPPPGRYSAAPQSTYSSASVQRHPASPTYSDEERTENRFRKKSTYTNKRFLPGIKYSVDAEVQLKKKMWALEGGFFYLSKKAREELQDKTKGKTSVYYAVKRKVKY